MAGQYLTIVFQGAATCDLHASRYGFSGAVNHFIVSESNVKFLELAHFAVYVCPLPTHSLLWFSLSRRASEAAQERPTCSTRSLLHPVSRGLGVDVITITFDSFIQIEVVLSRCPLALYHFQTPLPL